MKIEIHKGKIILDGLESNFHVNELYHPRDVNLALKLIDPTTIAALQQLRFYFDVPIIVNNRRNKNRGYRSIFSSVGADYSMHRLNKAYDFNVKGLSSDIVYDRILENQEDILDMGWTTIENKAFTKSWTHLDTRITNKDKIHIVSPSGISILHEEIPYH